MTKEAPKVFISYSHDDPDHKKWVANFGLRLRQNGVDAILDQWDLFPGEDIPVFMERNLSEANRLQQARRSPRLLRGQNPIKRPRLKRRLPPKR